MGDRYGGSLWGSCYGGSLWVIAMGKLLWGIAMGGRYGGVAMGDRYGGFAMNYRGSLVYGSSLSLEQSSFVSKASLRTLTLLSVQERLICFRRFFIKIFKVQFLIR